MTPHLRPLVGRRRSLLGVALTAVIAVAAACSSPARSPQAAGRQAGPAPVPTRATEPAPTATPATTSTSSTTSTTSSTTTSTTVPPTTTPAAPLGAPAPLHPLASPPLAGEGAWQPAGDRLAGGYGVYTTHLRPASGEPEIGVAWIGRTATRLSLYAGIGQPVGSWPQQGYVAPADQAKLLAAFNSGFKIYNYRTGWYDQGQTAEPLQPGAASLVILSDGTATVGEWGRDIGPGPRVTAVRQNLTLLVDHGAAVPAAAYGSDWGAVLGGGSVTWRSGVGVTAAGDLVYAGGPGLTPALLASVLVDAGAVRAMELDINPQWVSFATYSHPAGGISGANLVAGTYYGPSHYLAPYSRDFFAVFSR